MSLTNALDFTGKHVLITGASDGIGYGMANAFLDAGARVSVTGTKEAANYSNDFSKMNFYQLKVEDSAAIEDLVTKFDQLDVLINSVGLVLYKKQEFERDIFEKILTINLTGVMHLCTAFHDLLAVAEGNIINLDSVAGIRAIPSNPAYSASKAGLAHLTKSLAKRWGSHGIRVNGIAPGLIPTKLTTNQSGAEQEKEFVTRCPLGRFGTVEDIAGGALFLASPLAAYVTGHTVVIDGGLII